MLPLLFIDYHATPAHAATLFIAIFFFFSHDAFLFAIDFISHACCRFLLFSPLSPAMLASDTLHDVDAAVAMPYFSPLLRHFALLLLLILPAFASRRFRRFHADASC